MRSRKLATFTSLLLASSLLAGGVASASDDAIMEAVRRAEEPPLSLPPVLAVTEGEVAPAEVARAEEPLAAVPDDSAGESVAEAPAPTPARAAAPTDSGPRVRFVAPKQLAELYSDTELQAMLVFKADAACADDECEAVAAFRRKVEKIGARLAHAARTVARDLGTDEQNFEFVVAEKEDLGTLSSASGTIVVFDGVRLLDLEDHVLAFLIAREMGHVLNRHHDENIALKLAVSAVVTVTMPMLAVLRNTATAVSALSSTSLFSMAASSAASMAGAHVLKSIYRPDQLREADTVAMRLVDQAGWSSLEVAESLLGIEDFLEEGGWTDELLASASYMIAMTGANEWPYQPVAMGDATVEADGAPAASPSEVVLRMDGTLESSMELAMDRTRQAEKAD